MISAYEDRKKDSDKTGVKREHEIQLKKKKSKEIVKVHAFLGDNKKMKEKEKLFLREYEK